jgi:hypothetical protein
MFDVSDCLNVMDDPAWLLTGFDVNTRDLTFVETTRETLASSAFIDGRTPLSRSGKTATMSLREASSRLRGAQIGDGIDRLIAHVGFCGSTLLAQALDATAVCQTFKEPQVITEISALKTLRHPITRDGEEWRRLLDVVKSQFRKAFGQRLPIAKLSNWPVNLLPDFIDANTRAVFLTAEPREYMLAILRGGDERVSFTLTFARKLRRDFPGVHAAIGALEADPRMTRWQLILRCALIALRVQEQVFESVAGKAGATMRLEGRSLLASPDQTLAAVAEALALPMRRAERRRAVREAFSASSKQPWSSFDASAHAASNRKVLDVFAGEIDLALRWYEERSLQLL